MLKILTKCRTIDGKEEITEVRDSKEIAAKIKCTVNTANKPEKFKNRPYLESISVD